MALGCYQYDLDKDDLYASTPLLLTLKILLLLALLYGHTVRFADVSTAFLHATLDYDVFVVPPKEYYPAGDVLWKLRKAMYGLRTALKVWQDHYAEVMR